MSALKGLSGLKTIAEKSKNSGSKMKWLQLQDGQAVKLRFAQELDPDSPYYDESRGEPVVYAVHTNPKDWKRSAACTKDEEGRCYGCEMAQKEPKSTWYRQQKFFTNVLVDDGIEEPYVAVWSRSAGPKSIVQTILVPFFEETNGITNRVWTLKRNGTGKESTYSLIAKDPDSEPFDWSGHELFDLSKAIREIPYAEQEAFYFGFEAPSATSATNADW